MIRSDREEIFLRKIFFFFVTHHCLHHFSVRFVRFGCRETSEEAVEASSLYTDPPRVEVRLRKVDARLVLRKFSPSHFECRTRSVAFSRASPLPPPVQYFQTARVCNLATSSQQMRSIDFDDLDRKKNTGRTLARGVS